jgi:hypothetical protein
VDAEELVGVTRERDTQAGLIGDTLEPCDQRRAPIDLDGTYRLHAEARMLLPEPTPPWVVQGEAKQMHISGFATPLASDMDAMSTQIGCCEGRDANEQTVAEERTLAAAQTGGTACHHGVRKVRVKERHNPGEGRLEARHVTQQLVRPCVCDVEDRFVPPGRKAREAAEAKLAAVRDGSSQEPLLAAYGAPDAGLLPLDRLGNA